MTIHKEGHRMLIILLVILTALNLSIYFILPEWTLLRYIVGGFGLLLFLTVLQFFRSPSRKYNLNENQMISITHLHPMLVHFPIALILWGFIADVASILFKKEVCLSKLGFYLLIFGTLTSFLALLTGVLFTSEMSGAAGAVKETHELFAWITVATTAIALAFRIFIKTKNKEHTQLKWVAFILYGLATISVSITGFWGGTLVYSYMMPL